MPEERVRLLKDILARTKKVDEAIVEFRQLRDPTFEPVQANPFEANVIEEKDLIQRGYEIGKELAGGRYIVKQPNQH